MINLLFLFVVEISCMLCLLVYVLLYCFSINSVVLCAGKGREQVAQCWFVFIIHEYAKNIFHVVGLLNMVL